MKTYFFIFIIALLSCSKDDPAPTGCLSGVSKITGKRSVIRCSTEQEFKRGSHETQNWDNYTSHQWEVCDDCG